MTAIAHAPARAWAGAHRTLVLALALTVVLIAAAITTAVVLWTGDEGIASPTAPLGPGTSDSCEYTPVPSPC